MKAGSRSQNPAAKTPAAKRIFAGLLAVWLSGVVFLLCCTAPEAKAAETESCPLAKKGHCQKSANDEKALRFESFGSGGTSFDCCGFLPRVFDKFRKTEKSEQVAALPVQVKIAPQSSGFIKLQPVAFSGYRPPPPNRSGTYLKNRVFRI